MGQEISQQNKCSNIGRRQQQTQQQQQLHNNNSKHQNFNTTSKDSKETKYTKHKDLIYTSSSISTASSTDDEHYRQRQKYNLPKQTYEKTKLAKHQQQSRNSVSTTASSSSDYQTTNCVNPAAIPKKFRECSDTTTAYDKLGVVGNKQKHQRQNSQSTTDSGIYYSSCHCSSASSSVLSSGASSASSTSGCPASLVSSPSVKSLNQQKHYLSHHLYIKSYLDILEEDEKARAQFQSARPGGIRNYTPKILAETSSLSSSIATDDTSILASATTSSTKPRGKIKEDSWI